MRRFPFNRLWVQLSLAFATVVLVAAAVLLTAGALLRPERPAPPPLPIEPSTATESSPAPAAAPPEGQEQRLGFLAGAFIAIGITGTILGIIGGIWMARRLTAPLDALTRGAAAIGGRDLSYRVTERGSYETVTLARAFNQMAAGLEEGEELRQNLLADVAHELRTPLTVLQGNLRAILDDVYALDKAEVARLYDQTRHLSGLVNDLHELAQAEARKLPIAATTVNLTELLQSAVELLVPLAEEREIALHARLPDRAVTALVDPARTMQIVQNLLTNAIRHTPTGGTIAVDLKKEAEAAVIVITDSGDGIAPDHLDHLFDRFYRTDTARDRDSGGAGLGLAIVRALAELQGGRVSAASPGAGQGATFTVCLPSTRSE